MTEDEKAAQELEDFLNSAPVEEEPLILEDQGEPKEPQEPSEPAEPAEPKEPVEPSEPAEPVEPVEPATPDEPKEPVEPAEPVEVPVTEREKLLLKRIETLTGQSLGIEDAIAEPAAVTTPTEEPVPTDQPAAVPAVPVEPEKPNFLKDMTLDEVLDDPEKFNQVLQAVYARGVEDASKQSSENVLRSIPKLVTSYVGRQTVVNTMVNDFYKEHPDLVNVKKTVAAIANEVAAEDPGLAVDKVFEETAKRTRETLGMKAKAVSNTPAPDAIPKDPDTPVVPDDPNLNPAFAEQKGRKGPASSGLKGLAKEVNELIT